MPKKSSKQTLPQTTDQGSPVRILYLEKDLLDVELFRHHLEKEQYPAVLRVVETRQQFQHELATFAPDCIVLDYHLPLFSAPEALQVLREQQIVAGVIVFTGSVSEEQAIECLRLGADDYVTKQNPQRLVSAIQSVIEKKKMEKAFRQKSRELERYFENSLDLLCIADTDGYFRRLNPEWERILGYPLPELSGKKFLDFVHPDDLPATYEALAALSSQKQVLNFINRYRCRDGSFKWLEWHSYPEGETIFAMARDITEKKQAEERSASLNNDLQTINRVILSTASGLDLMQKLDIILDESLAITGLEGGTVCLINPDDTFDLAAHRETSRETIEDLSTNKIKIGECLCGHCAKDGRPLILRTREEVLAFATREVLRGEDIRFHAAFPFVVAGNCVGVLCVFTRTNRKPPESSLKLLETIVMQTAISVQNARLWEANKKHRETLSSIYNTVGDVIFQLAVERDEVYRFVSINPAFCRVTGLTAEQIVGKAVHQVIPEPSLSMVLENYREAIRSKSPVTWEETSDYPSGRLIGEVRVAPLFDEHGHCTHLVGSVHDITERRSAENLLRALSSRQEAILAAVPDIIMEVDNRKVYTWANKSGFDFFGEDVIGKEAAFYFEGEQDTYGIVQPLFNGAEEVFYIESWQRRKDGQKRLLAWWCRVLKDERGKVTGALSSAQDITVRKRSEEQIMAQLNELRLWQKVMIGREERILEMKKEVNHLLRRLGEPETY
jgi:PAS domain S-box-containing protein